MPPASGSRHATGLVGPLLQEMVTSLSATGLPRSGRCRSNVSQSDGRPTLLPVRAPASVAMRTAVGFPAAIRLNRMGRRFRRHELLIACAFGFLARSPRAADAGEYLLHHASALRVGISTAASLSVRAPEGIRRLLFHRASFSAARCGSRQRTISARDVLESTSFRQESLSASSLQTSASRTEARSAGIFRPSTSMRARSPPSIPCLTASSNGALRRRPHRPIASSSRAGMIQTVRRFRSTGPKAGSALDRRPKP